MSKMKKYLLTGISYVLVAALAIGGTIAYLQDTDEDVNVMTLGNVQIEQHEYEREVDADGNYVTYTETKREGNPTGYKLAPFSQAKPLYPAVGEALNFDATKVYFAQLDGNAIGTQAPFNENELKNAQDKFVFVENTGKTDAYVRTIIAFEIGTAENAIAVPNNANENLIMMNCNQFWTRNFIGEAKIDNNNYYLVEFVYDGANGTNTKHPDGIVHPGEFTFCNLAQVYMTPKATNEDVKAIDGNGNGTYDILVFSQAVQAAGFENAKTALDTAFGATTVNNHPWIGNAPVIPAVGADGLAAALEKGGDVAVAGEVNPDEAMVVPSWGKSKMECFVDAGKVDSLSGGEYVLDEGAKYGVVASAVDDQSLTLSNMKITADSQWSMLIDNSGKQITVEDVTITAKSGAGLYAYGTGVTVLDNVQINHEKLDPTYEASTPWAATAVAVSSMHNVVINDGTYVGSTWAVYSYNSGSNITINGGKFKAARVLQADGVWNTPGAKSVITVNGGSFDGAVYLDWGTTPPEIYINGGSFTNFSATVCGAAKLVITGGTFDANPSAYVPAGYAATENNGVWTVSAI